MQVLCQEQIPRGHPIELELLNTKERFVEQAITEI
jgi:hypothetical protein